ncbi:MAG TPA: hypothetical protein VNO70_04505 [Blastocatellia bacterium]|nr:hypothetical protein [Blastocatellia bacterium]
MLKRKARQEKTTHPPSGGRRKAGLAIILVLSLMAVGGVLAQLGALQPATKALPAAGAQAQPASLSPASPSKEYIYAGGRLVATEEPSGATQPPPAYEGYFDVAGCRTLFGWAWDANQPNATINVDIYDGATLLASVPANFFRLDLAYAAKGSGAHAFLYTVPASLKDGQPHTIHVKYAGTNLSLNNSGRVITCSNVAPTYQGYHDGAACDVISGWAWDATHPYDRVGVELWDGPTLVARVFANGFRPDLLAAGIGDGEHAFHYPTPHHLKDGQAHQITVRHAATGANLGTTPKTLVCPPPVYQGSHDAANCSIIGGWAWDANQPNSPIWVDIYDGSTLLATVLASQFREDLPAAGIGNGYHAFTYYVPPRLRDGQAHTIWVRYAGTNTLLGTSGKTMTCTP